MVILIKLSLLVQKKQWCLQKEQLNSSKIKVKERGPHPQNELHPLIN